MLNFLMVGQFVGKFDIDVTISRDSIFSESQGQQVVILRRCI